MIDKYPICTKCAYYGEPWWEQPCGYCNGGEAFEPCQEDENDEKEI
jgi:hypothetical protein